MNRIPYKKIISCCVCIAAMFAATTGMLPKVSAQVGENEKRQMKILVVYNPTSCFKASAVKNMGAETAPLPVVYQAFPDAGGEVNIDDETALGEWLREKEADGVIWFSCENSSVHLYAFTDQWLRQDRALNPDSPRIFEDAISAVVDYWMRAVVPQWQQARTAAKQDFQANLRSAKSKNVNEKKERPVVSEPSSTTVKNPREVTPSDKRLPIRGGRINLEADVLGVLVQSNHFLPGVQGGAGGKIGSQLELYATGGVLKVLEVQSDVQASRVKATIKSVLFGIGVRSLRPVKTGTLDLTLMLEGVLMPYDTVVSTGETQSGRPFQLSLNPMAGMTVALFPHGYLTLHAGARLLLVRPKFFAKTDDGNVLLYSPAMVEPLVMAGIGIEIF